MATVNEGLYARLKAEFDVEEYTELCGWISTCDGATWDFNGGFYLRGGFLYFIDLLLDTEEDMLMCKLKFSDMLTFYTGQCDRIIC